MIGLIPAYKAYWLKAFCWRGRSTRAELLWPGLVNAILFIFILHMAFVSQFGQFLFLLIALFQIITFFPGLAVFIRRAHDIGKSTKLALTLTVGLLAYNWLITFLTKVIHNSVFYIFSGISLIVLGILACVLYAIIAFRPSQNFPNKYGDPR